MPADRRRSTLIDQDRVHKLARRTREKATVLTIERRRTQNPAQKPNKDSLGFGRYLTDHMLVADHEAGGGWTKPRIVPRGSESVDAASGVVQYNLSIFEGLKAHRDRKGDLRLFRPDAHARRFVTSAKRLCLPPVDPELFVEGVRALVNEDADWYPNVTGGSIYVRPTLLADECFLGVRPATHHTLVILLSPVGHYFAKGESSLRLWAERDLVRAAPGGVGSVKTGGNYAASLLASQRAQERGFDQVLWLDAHEHRYLEEVGTMNVFVSIGGKVITPPLGDTLLAGVTRDSCLTLLREWNVPVEERKISIDEILEADRRGELEEIWGTGTAAVISPVGEIAWDEVTVRPRGGPIALRLRRALEQLFTGETSDTRGWLLACK